MTEETKVDDFKERAEAFVADYGELVKMHGVDFATYPVYVPDNGSFRTVVQNTPVDVRNSPVKSPVQAPIIQEDK